MYIYIHVVAYLDNTCVYLVATKAPYTYMCIHLGLTYVRTYICSFLQWPMYETLGHICTYVTEVWLAQYVLHHMLRM